MADSDPTDPVDIDPTATFEVESTTTKTRKMPRDCRSPLVGAAPFSPRGLCSGAYKAANAKGRGPLSACCRGKRTTRGCGAFNNPIHLSAGMSLFINTTYWYVRS